MSRPLRIEYPGAWYHVMNRALTGQDVFVTEADFQNFLALVEEAWCRWRIRVLGYCLMDNHYHLAIQTPEGNLQRVMRHIDGVYTQRFNRYHKRDGPLFRGRYKAILIHADQYLAAVVRYIHLNPVEASKAESPEGYSWSSHRYYLSPKKAPSWLAFQEVLSRYRSPRDFHAFVLSGNEEALLRFYSSKRRSPILGGEEFVAWVKEGPHPISSEHVGYEARLLRPLAKTVLQRVAESYGVSDSELLRSRRGRRNEPRKVAMYLVRELCDRSLNEIAEVFSLGRYASVGAACASIQKDMNSDQRLRNRIQQIREACVEGYSQKKT